MGTAEQLTSMRDGSGDGWFCVFGPRRCVPQGVLPRECDVAVARCPRSGWASWKVCARHVRRCVAEPALAVAVTTFSVWRGNDDDSWHRVAISFPDAADADGSTDLLARAGCPSCF